MSQRLDIEELRRLAVPTRLELAGGVGKSLLPWSSVRAVARAALRISFRRRAPEREPPLSQMEIDARPTVGVEQLRRKWHRRQMAKARLYVR